MNVTVVGLGYIGLPTACLLADAGHNVKGVDINELRVNTIKKGILPFEETGLQLILDKVIKNKKLQVSTKLFKSEAFIIAVPTPQKRAKADLIYVKKALEDIMSVMQGGELIIIESTIYPGASKKEILPMLLKNKKPFLLAHCPERAIPGKTLFEMVQNNRIIGGLTEKSLQKTKNLYVSFVKGNIDCTDITTAECCKVMENTYRDVNIALANEYAKIAKDIGINVWEAISLANKHPRVDIHSPGPGVGGHCIPVDPWFFVGVSKEARLIRNAREINDNMPSYVMKQILDYAKKYNIQKPVIGILGLSYKKNVGDIRESPVFKVLEILKKKKMQHILHDPFIHERNSVYKELNEVLQKANIILLMTDHDIYKTVDFLKYKNIQFIYDTRHCLQNIYGTIPVYTLGDGISHRNYK